MNIQKGILKLSNKTLEETLFILELSKEEFDNKSFSKEDILEVCEKLQISKYSLLFASLEEKDIISEHKELYNNIKENVLNLVKQ